MPLHSHQEDAIQACEEAILFDNLNRILVQAPTGSGKTMFAAAFASRRITYGQRFIFLAHREKLLTQAMDEFSEYFDPTTFGLVQGAHNDAQAQHLFASVPTIQNDFRFRQCLIKGAFDLIIVDECHRSLAPSWLKVIRTLLEKNPNAILIGMTATPMRSDQQSLRKLYEDCVSPVTMLDLIAQDPPKLCDLRRVSIVVPDLHLKDVPRGDDGDFSEKELAEAAAKSVLRYKLGIDAVLRYTPRDEDGNIYPGLVFAIDKADVRGFTKFANAAGLPTEAILGETSPAERRRIEWDLDEGKLTAISNCNVFTEGVDIPKIRWILMLRHTASQGLYIQIIGRAARVLKEDIGKPYEEWSKKEALIFDVADNDHSVLVLPDILGITEEKMGKRSIREVVKDKDVTATEPKEIVYKPGNMKVQVASNSLFTSRQWTALGYDKSQWQCKSEVGTAYVERDFAGYTSYFVSPTGQKKHLLNTPRSIELAFGAGEMHMQQLEQKAAHKQATKYDLASPERIARLRQLKSFRWLKPNARLTNQQVDEFWRQFSEAKKSGTSWHAQYRPKQAKPKSSDRSFDFSEQE